MRLIGKRTRFAGALLVAAAAALPFLAAPAPADAAMPLVQYFVWTDAGSGHAWSTTANWTCPLGHTYPCGYPDATNENARFLENSCTPWEVQHVDEEVGIILLNDSVNLTGSSVTLQCESLVIDNNTGCDLTLEITGSSGQFIAVP
jgi:hypothetical protein